jgi:hypothetical protein
MPIRKRVSRSAGSRVGSDSARSARPKSAAFEQVEFVDGQRQPQRVATGRTAIGQAAAEECLQYAFIELAVIAVTERFDDPPGGGFVEWWQSFAGEAGRFGGFALGSGQCAGNQPQVLRQPCRQPGEWGTADELVEGVDQQDDATLRGGPPQQVVKGAAQFVGGGAFVDRFGDAERLCEFTDPAADHGIGLPGTRADAGGVHQQQRGVGRCAGAGRRNRWRRRFLGRRLRWSRWRGAGGTQPLRERGEQGALARAGFAGEAQRRSVGPGAQTEAFEPAEFGGSSDEAAGAPVEEFLQGVAFAFLPGRRRGANALAGFQIEFAPEVVEDLCAEGFEAADGLAVPLGVVGAQAVGEFFGEAGLEGEEFLRAFGAFGGTASVAKASA